MYTSTSPTLRAVVGSQATGLGNRFAVLILMILGGGSFCQARTMENFDVHVS